MKPETRLDIATRLVIEAEALVARQQQLVAHLDVKGHSVEQANRLLDNFEVSLKNFRNTLALLQSTQSTVKLD